MAANIMIQCRRRTVKAIEATLSEPEQGCLPALPEHSHSKAQAFRWTKPTPKQFSGVIPATPYTGCLSKFVRNFKAEICLIDEAAKVGLLQIVWKHSPKFLLVIGDPAQLGPHVQLSFGDEIHHPFQEYLT